jgi:hypothetical protein
LTGFQVHLEDGTTSPIRRRDDTALIG